MSPLLDLVKRLFSRERADAPVDPAVDPWTSEFAAGDPGPFTAEESGSYAAAVRDGALDLELRKPNLFAWTDAPALGHADFVIEGEFAFGPDNAHSACGFLLRKGNDSNFYAVLVSNRGYARMDAVFNGRPRPVFGWTECGGQERGPGSEPFTLRVIAHGPHFTVMVDGEWVAEAEDDSFRSGHAAFAAQNYGEGGPALFRLRSCLTEPRPLEVEAWHYRYNYYEQPEPGARLRLARTFSAMGAWLPAAVQLRKLEKRSALSTEALFLKAEVSLRLDLLEEAEAAVDAVLALEPGNLEAALEKANILHQTGRYLELRDRAAAILARDPDSVRALTLSGHARFGLGDYVGAQADYGRAAALEPGQPILRMNEARAREHSGDRRGAAASYLEAARGFFEAEADDDLALALARIEALDPRNPELAATRAKVLFRQGKRKEAAAALGKLIAAGTADAAIHYLSGLFAREEGKRDLALERFEEAARLEPSYPLYAFRRAEALFLASRPEAGEAIAKALELAPENGWTCNLAAMALLRKAAKEGQLPTEETAEARRLLGLARAALPGAVEPELNLAELESLSGNADAALAALEPFPGDAAARNQRGNVLARAGRVEEAAREYAEALRSAPGNPEYLCNHAAALLELERWTDAEDCLRKALEAGVTPRACLLAANLAMVYGDWVRAEASCRLGLEAAEAAGGGGTEDSAGLLFALGRAYLAGRKGKKAEEAARRLETLDPERAARLREELLEATTEGISCATCGRAWRVPRDLPSQSGASIRAMPPDDSPAGACPRCGKVFCIACRKADLVENRFTCPDCGETLKLQDHRLRWLVLEHLKRGD